jgi:hypothetical protein
MLPAELIHWFFQKIPQETRGTGTNFTHFSQGVLICGESAKGLFGTECGLGLYFSGAGTFSVVGGLYQHCVCGVGSLGGVNGLVQLIAVT